MGFRFRKIITLLPGVRLNFSKGFPSLTIGGRGGLTLNIGRKGVRGTVGAPGTGLSYSRYRPFGKKSKKSQQQDGTHGV